MLSFWILAALLVTIALCYVLPPLLQRAEQRADERERANINIYRDQFAELERDLRDGVLDKEQYEQGRIELQRRLLEDVAAPQPAGGTPHASSARSGRATATILGAGIPLAAIILYSQIGTPKALAPGQPAATAVVSNGREAEAEAPMNAPTGPPGAPSQQEIEQRVANLAARLKENPDDAQGWAMLARSYQNFKRYREASEAYARAAELKGNDAQLWADYAESLALANDSQLAGRPREIINKALQLDPNNEKALWLAGHAAFQTENFAQAVSYWEQLAELLPKESEAARSVAASIEEARARAAGK
jgi:cytochrome c-type biogenesis protein CcmH